MIKLEMRNLNMILTEKQQKYQHYDLEKLMNVNILQMKKHYHLIKRSVIEQTKFSHSPLGKVFEKETKMTEEKDEKQIDAITDQKKRLETLSNKDDHKSIDKKIFDRVVIEKFDEIKELTNEIDHDDLIYHFKNNTNKNINDFDDGIELFQKIQSGEMN